MPEVNRSKVEELLSFAVRKYMSPCHSKCSQALKENVINEELLTDQNIQGSILFWTHFFRQSLVDVTKTNTGKHKTKCLSHS